MLKKFLLGSTIAIVLMSAGHAQDNPLWPGLSNEQIDEALERGDSSALTVRDDDLEVAIGTPTWEPDIDGDGKCYWRLYWQVQYKDGTVHWRSRMIKKSCSEPPPNSFINTRIELSPEELDQALRSLLGQPDPATLKLIEEVNKILNDHPEAGEDLLGGSDAYKTAKELQKALENEKDPKAADGLLGGADKSSTVDTPKDNDKTIKSENNSQSSEHHSSRKADSNAEKSDSKSTGNSEHSNAKSAGTVEHANAKLEKNTDHATRAVVHEKSEITHQVAHTAEAGHGSGLHEGGMHGRLGSVHGGGFGGLGGMHGGGLGGLGGLLLGGLGRL